MNSQQSGLHNKKHKEEKSLNNNLGSTRSIYRRVYDRKFTLLFIILIIITSATIFYKTFKPQPKSVTVKKTIMKQVLVKRSKDLALINRALTGKAIDVATGKIVKAARIFSPDDKTIYLELDLFNAPKGTVIDYIRYKEGRYVDHGEVMLAKNDTKNILFSFMITKVLGATHNGKWKIATYTNGVLAKRVAYEIRNNKVSYVYPEQAISASDPDYNFGVTLESQIP